MLAAAVPDLGIGFAGVALAFGLTVLTMAYAVGAISGGHFNPAVSVGLVAGGRFPIAEFIPYVIAQVIGAIAAGGVLYLIASGKAGFDASAGFASNGYGEHSPGGYSLQAALVCEIVMTFFFVMIIMGATHGRAPAGFAPIAIGFALTLIHLISIPVTNTSVNPGALDRRGGCSRAAGRSGSSGCSGSRNRRRRARRLRVQGALGAMTSRRSSAANAKARMTSGTVPCVTPTHGTRSA